MSPTFNRLRAYPYHQAVQYLGSTAECLSLKNAYAVDQGIRQLLHFWTLPLPLPLYTHIN